MAEQQGWICPKCGRVYAPWVKECEACNQAVKVEPVSPWYPIIPWIPYPDYPGTAPYRNPWDPPFYVTYESGGNWGTLQ